MARKQGSGFKMKRGPMKDLGSFFSSFGKQLVGGQKERGIFSEKGKAEKKEMRKTGESKYQFDIRKRKEAKKLKPGEFSTKRKLEGDLVVNQELMNKKVDESKDDSGSGSGSGSNKSKSLSTSFSDAFKAARKAHGGDGGTFEWEGKKYSTNVKKPKKVIKENLKENLKKKVVEKKSNTIISDRLPASLREVFPNLTYEDYIKSPKKWEDGYRNWRKNNPISKKAKGSRGYKMKRK